MAKTTGDFALLLTLPLFRIMSSMDKIVLMRPFTFLARSLSRSHADRRTLLNTAI